MRRVKAYRDLKALDLVVEFARIIPNAYIMKARDARYLAAFMEMDALDAIDVLWGFTEYRATDLNRDIPSFIRWFRRQSFDLDERTGIEARLAERLSGKMMPPKAMVYFDLIHEGVSNAHITKAFLDAEVALTAFADSVLGVRRNDPVPAVRGDGRPRLDSHD